MVDADMGDMGGECVECCWKDVALRSAFVVDCFADACTQSHSHSSGLAHKHTYFF